MDSIQIGFAGLSGVAKYAHAYPYARNISMPLCNKEGNGLVPLPFFSIASRTGKANMDTIAMSANR
ncbi:MAG: hypothetical protein GY744_14380 [Gammaproteobacteria bacterium]|nr:hypothetical protein [Gammaproteobacteria bacterium]